MGGMYLLGEDGKLYRLEIESLGVADEVLKGNWPLTLNYRFGDCYWSYDCGVGRVLILYRSGDIYLGLEASNSGRLVSSLWLATRGPDNQLYCPVFLGGDFTVDRWGFCSGDWQGKALIWPLEDWIRQIGLPTEAEKGMPIVVGEDNRKFVSLVLEV